jgi:NTP pyrophosphohydrolases containing a Zn-finger, probably nucleic-acid-binding
VGICRRQAGTGATLPQALVRECREERGIRVTPQEIFTQLVHTYPDITVRLTLVWKQTQDTPQRLEHNDQRWISVDEIDHVSVCPADRDIPAKIKEMEF